MRSGRCKTSVLVQAIAGTALSAMSAAFVASVGVGCIETSVVPDPKVAAESYAAAAERGDGAAIYAMLTRRSRASMTEADVTQAVAGAKAELAEQARQVHAATPSIVTVAQLRWDDGTEATLMLENGAFRVASTGLLPGGGTTPEETLSGLREALKRRSYGALLRVLTPELRAAVESQLRGLVEGLADPATLELPTMTSDLLTVQLPNGHRVTLRRTGTTWYVENFE